jgi:plasmid stability protein
MTTMVQIRNVPVGVHRSLKAKAALAGLTLSDFLLAELRAIAERPSPEELRARLGARSAPALSISPTEALRRERDAK